MDAKALYSSDLMARRLTTPSPEPPPRGYLLCCPTLCGQVMASIGQPRPAPAAESQIFQHLTGDLLQLSFAGQRGHGRVLRCPPDHGSDRSGARSGAGGCIAAALLTPHGAKSRPDAASAPHVNQSSHYRWDPSPSRRKSTRTGPCGCRQELPS